jgi:hypothetical protein
MTVDPDLIQQYQEETIEFFMVLAADHLTGATGKSPSVALSKNNGAFGAALGTVSEVGYGWYSIKLDPIDSGVVGTLIFHITAADCDALDFAKEVISREDYASLSPVETVDDAYISVSGADLYFNERLNSEVWTVETVTNKEKALKTATRYINRLNFAGDKTDENQTFEFPRGGDTEIPQEVQDATCEIAIALLDGRDIEFEHEMGNLESSGFGGGRLRSESEWIPEAKAHGIPSIVAWNLLKPFLRDGRHITLNRVS